MTQERPANAVSRPVSASQAPEVPVEGSTVQDDWRAALAAQLAEQFSYAAQYATVVLDWDEEADELLPVVRRIVAAELRAAGVWLRTDEDDGGAGYYAGPDRTPVYESSAWAAAHLNDRADRLDAIPDHGKA